MYQCFLNYIYYSELILISIVIFYFTRLKKTNNACMFLILSSLNTPKVIRW